MGSSTGELAILLIGIIAALSSFHHYFAAEGEKRKSLLFISLLVLSIGTQVGTQGLQYYNAVMTRHEQERRISEALFVMNQTDETLVLKIADPSRADYNAYIVGYWYFKHGNYDSAKRYLSLAIHNQRFVPQSYYLLATINRLTQSNKSEAWHDYKQALENDHAYCSPYYGLAILSQESNDLDTALEDLEHATLDGKGPLDGIGPCWDMRNPVEQKTIWTKIKDSPRFHQIADQCGARFGLLSPAEPPNSKN